MKEQSKSTLKRWSVRAAIVVGLWQLWVYYNPTSVVHYPLEATFEVDSAPVSASSVQKPVVRWVRGLSSKKAAWQTYGEALRVDLPGRGAVYQLMTSPTPEGVYTFAQKGRFDFLISDACRLKQNRGKRNRDQFVRFVGEISGTCEIPLQHLPLMVRFQDETVSTSVERVLPDGLKTSSGEGVSFVSASVTIADEPISQGLSRHLPWLKSTSQQRLDPDFFSSENPTLAETLMLRYFRRLEE